MHIAEFIAHIPARKFEQSVVLRLKDANIKVSRDGEFTTVLVIHPTDGYVIGAAKRNETERDNPKVGEQLASYRAYCYLRDHGWQK